MKSDIGDSRPRPRWKQWLIQKLDLTSHCREDLLQEVQQASEKHLLPQELTGMMQSLIEFSALQVRDIMVPRPQVSFVYHDDTLPKILQRIAETGHSRYPVLGEDKEKLSGILLAKDLLKYSGREAEFKLADIIRTPLIIPDSQPLNRLLAEFRTAHLHLAVVIDEYSAIVGIVTFEDVLEQIVGEIDDEHDADSEDPQHIVTQMDGSYLVDATTPIEEFNQLVGAQFDTDDYDTIAGIVLDEMGRIPQQGDEITIDKWLFRVLRSDQRRIQLLEVLPRTQNSYSQPSAAV